MGFFTYEKMLKLTFKIAPSKIMPASGEAS